uniref:Uncharacterized protein n=1 Tax=Oryza barthii TaxID=65489 RepID=A0A0D3H1K1_9ORYZ
MPSSPWIPTAGAPPPRAAPAVVYSWLSERHPVKEAGAGAGASNAQESRPRVSPAENSEVETREHEEKVNKYQAVLAARLKAKYFSGKAFGKENVFEEMTIQSETILLSRCPFSSLFADPAKFCREKSCTKEDIYPSLTNASFAKHNHLSLVREDSSNTNIPGPPLLIIPVHLSTYMASFICKCPWNHGGQMYDQTHLNYICSHSYLHATVPANLHQV